MYVDLGPEEGSGQPLGMAVSPDKLLQLKAGFEEERDRINMWLFDNRRRLHSIDPPGDDPCSRDAMAVFGQNGSIAVAKAEAYVERLTTVAQKMHESAVAYGLVEEDNSSKFRQEPE